MTKRRRPFGLDAPRAPDLGRLEAAILRWLSRDMPDVLPLPVLPPPDQTGSCTERRPGLLALLLPDARVALLRLAAPSQDPGPDILGIAVLCRSRRLPLSIVTSLEEARQALRRLGFEPQNR